MATVEFYRQRAAQAQLDAEKATLTNVRERHLVARDTWNDMAEKAESVIATRAATEAEKRALAETA
ncbi:hypothetical protein DXH95_11750 [Sphingorhabdus pulchriflava]|uniref:Uncharacterized protein n=1 Tax=Sphingorhabdus pulchriflava TaxID=2292257 RepID=A0A371B543_9SPHN|nr:hypothetical protein [Sphingorhabdus pulchriflava]RDV02627.1 hypothetical protein DXH95_11750 [Sphingorhabdus pulchriflava]